MTRFLFLACWILWGQSTFAQHHDNNWIFGYDNLAGNPNSMWGGVIMHFEAGYPQFSLENIKMNYDVYCAVCSDSSGNLIFHTNGIRLRNRLHEIMEGGDTINPGQIWYEYGEYGYPSITGGTAVPAPGYSNRYYLFHTSSNDDLTSPINFPILYNTVIDMNANGGLGKVISANNILAEGDIDFPVLIKHGNGRDWWLLAGDYLNKTYQTFFIDPGGVHPVIEQDAPEAFLGTSGYHEASPDGRYYVNNDDYGLWVYDFDRCTGLLSNPRVLPYQPPIFYTSSIAFSQDSRFLYLGTHLAIYQMDMTTLDSPFISIDTIAYFDRGFSPWPPFYTQFLTPELAPDGKIYYNTFSSTQAYHVVNRPGLPLDASDLAQRGQIIPRWRNGTWCYFPNYRLGRWSGSPCDTLSFKSPSDAEFQHIPWSESGARQEGTATVKTLQWPPWITIPGQKPVQDEPDKGIRPDEVLKEHLRDRNSTRREYASPVNEKE